MRPWTSNVINLDSGPAPKFDSTTCSSEESLIAHKPLVIGKGVVRLPSILSNKNGLPTVSETDCLDTSNKENLYGSVLSEGSSEELFRPRPIRKVLSESNRCQIIDKAFSCFDDPFARVPYSASPKPLTPKSFLLPLKTPNSAQRDRYVTNEQKTALRKAAVEGEKDFIRVLEKCGIDPDEHFSSLSSKKKTSKKVNFDFSTPKERRAPDYCDTPSDNSCLVDTPLSGFNQLTSDVIRPDISPFRFDFSNASSPADDLSESSFLETSIDRELPPDIKSSLLSGIVCYVDCRSGKEDRTESVKSELISLGAKVEKNFTKKVTHVVFKEGKMSTYIKAKKQNIPIVGILWIEACKRVRGIADPSVYRPHKMDKYDGLLPFQMLTKRRLAILNPKSKVRRNLMELCSDTPSPTSPKKRRTRAATEIKRKRSREDSDSSDKHCTKKLFIENCDNNNDKNDKIPPEIISINSSSSDNSSLSKEEARLRRKSAPGKLLSKKNAKKQDLKAYFKRIEEEAKKSKERSELRIPTDEIIDTRPSKDDHNDFDPRLLLTGLSQLSTQERRKIQLFDPNQSPSLSQRSGIDDSEPSIVVEDPYPCTTPKRVRTKATIGARRPLKDSLTRKLHNNVKKAERFESDSSPSSLWFMEKPDSQAVKQQEPPSITFTSIPKSELPKYTEIVKKLGKFTVDDKVTKHTTHLVSDGPRRTINLIKGIARGCWLIDLKWIIESEKSEKWLPHDNFSLFHAFPAAAECCKVRRSLKTTRVIDIFKDAGKIYVSHRLKGSPHYSDVEELLRICAASLAPASSEAEVIVGKSRKEAPPGAVCVSVKWVLDSVTQNTLLPFDDFLENEVITR